MMIPGYEVIQEIGRNDWQALYRARRHTDQQSVLLKFPHRQASGAIEIKLLEHEFETLRNLALAGVPRAYDLIRDDGVFCLALEDRGGVPLRALLGGQQQSLDSFFKIALKLAALLAELHRREIIHQSINPDNILINTRPARSLWPVSVSPRAALEKRKRRYHYISCAARSFTCRRSRLGVGGAIERRDAHSHFVISG